MAYTSIIPVSRLDNSITYIRNKDKTTKKGQSAGSLEEAIQYAMNRVNKYTGTSAGDAFCFILNILPLSGRGLGRAAAAGRCPRRRHIRRRPFRLKHE